MKNNDALLSELASLGVKVRKFSKGDRRVGKDDLLVRRFASELTVLFYDGKIDLPVREGETNSNYRTRYNLAQEIASELAFPGSVPARRNPWVLVHKDGYTYS